MSENKKQFMFQLGRLLSSQDLMPKRFGKWLTRHRSFAIEHLPDKEESICKIFKTCVVIIFMVKRSKLFKNRISSMLEYPLKNKWTTFLDKLSSLEDQNTLAMYLFKIFVQESISKEKALQPFWTPAYETISEKLLLPIETDCAGSDSSLSNHWSQKLEEKSPFLTVQARKQVNKNLQKTSYQSSMSSLVDKWVKEAIPEEKTKTFKTVQIKIFPSKKQKQLLDDFINTSRYVSNKAIEQIEKGHKPHFPSLRDLLVTSNTKKYNNTYIKSSEEIMTLHALKHKLEDSHEKQAIIEEINTKNKILKEQMKLVAFEKNKNLQEFENLTPKEIRANAVQSVCDAYKSAFANLKNGNIKFFKMKYKSKKAPRQTIELAPACISFNNGVLKILPKTFKEECMLRISNKNKKKHKNLRIENNVDVVRQNGNYFVHILKVVDKKEKKTQEHTICGIDPGVRTFATVYSYTTKDNEHTSDICVRDYEHRVDLLKKLNNKKDQIMARRGVRKKQYTKIEKKKKNIVDCLHWNTINHVLQHNDIVFYGDIKSQDITKGNLNKQLNRDFNDLKFYIFKTRLKYKASVLQKHVIFLNESYTTKTCSSCGKMNDNVGSKKVFSCSSCNLVTGRDLNASKNILMKGLLS